MNQIKNKWKIIKDMGKKNFILYRVILQRMIMLGIILSVLSGIFSFGTGFLERESFYLKTLIVLVVYAFLGVLIGNMEWNFYKVVNDDEATEEVIKKYYSRVHGILSFGLPLWFVNAVFDYKSFIGNLISLVIWVIVGYIYGVWTYKKVLKDSK
ncbi:MAG: hypothetical protein ACQERZ_00160 [Fusobacteriota bacterium]